MNRDTIIKRKPIITIILVAVNIGIFLLLEMMGNTDDTGFMLSKGAMFTPYVLERAEYYRLFTCMFLHFGINHIANNMICLAGLGAIVEDEVGKVRFAIIYLVSGLVGNIVPMILDMKELSPIAVSAGASGAIMGIAGAFLFIVIKNKGQLGGYTTGKVLFFIALTIYAGIRSTGVDNVAHISGAVAGFIVAAIVYGLFGSRKKTSLDEY